MNHAPSVLPAETDPDEAFRRRAEAEYREMPGLKLSAAQAARLWHLGLLDSERLLESLVARGLLHRSQDGEYLLLWSR